jgi:hypothetical protein
MAPDPPSSATNDLDVSRLHPIKLRAIDRAFELTGARSFADLGGVWAVDGGYTFYARDRPGIVQGTLVDDLIDSLSPAARQRADERGVRLLTGNFSDRAVAKQVGTVDAVLLFDVLLHQVAPDWDEILDMYAERTRTFVIVQPQANDDKTVRLIDLGREEYLRRVPPNEPHDLLFDRLDEPHRGRTWRDVHDVWQWGIGDSALTSKMEGLGFKLIHREDGGPWMGSAYFDNVAYVFTRA